MSPKRSRQSNWVHPGGVRETTEIVHQTLLPFTDWMRVDVYPSDCMSTGIDSKVLEDKLPILTALMLLDPRGVYFSNPVVADALAKFLATDGRFAQHALDENLEVEIAIRLTAYKLRVMLSHVRLKYDGRLQKYDTWEDPFAEIFNIIRDSPKDVDVGGTQKQKRAERLASRPYPFIVFRIDKNSQAAAAENENEDGDDAVACVFDHHQQKPNLYTTTET